MTDLPECPECGRPQTELTAGGTIRYCWWCEDRAASDHGAYISPRVPFRAGPGP